MTTAIDLRARLKPRAAKTRKGVPQTPARYMFRGVRFEEAKGWYKITDAELARELRELTHNDREDGIAIFDVCTPAQAGEIQKRESRARTRVAAEDAELQTVTPIARRTSARAGAITTSDVVPVADMADPDPDGTELDEEDAVDGAEPIGRLPDGPPQELDDGDDLLDDGAREPRAPKVTDAPSPTPRTRTAAKATAAPKAAAAPKSSKRGT